MVLTLNELKCHYIDKIAEELLLEIESQTGVHQLFPDNTGTYNFMHEKQVIDMGTPVGPVYEFSEDLMSRLTTKHRIFEGSKIGYSESGFKKIYKLVETIQKDKGFNLAISERFLANLIYDWLLETHIDNPNPINSLSSCLLKSSNAAIQAFNVFIPVLYLESDLKIVIGITTFTYIKDEEINFIAEKISADRRHNYVEWLKTYKGQLYAICTIEAEKNRCIEIATEYSMIAVDALRLMAPTVMVPDLPCFFDIDFRNIHQLSSHNLVQPTDELNSISVNTNSKPKPYIINDIAWRVINEEGLKHIHDFILKTWDGRTELDRLILKAIANFSKAISTLDLHERVVQLFTVLESLLLGDESSPVIDSVCKYLPKIITKDVEERKMITKTVKEMYKVRSSMIHHAQKRQFEVENLRIIQVCCRALIINLITLSYQKQSKIEILKEIDDLIMSA